MSITSALAAQRKRLAESKDEGFTLIELLVVVLIIGILAAIAIPVFLGQQDQARDSAAESDLANARVAMVAYSVDNDGDYTTTTADLADYGYVQSTEAAATIPTAGADGFCIQVASDTGTVFSVTDTSGVTEAACGGAEEEEEE